MSGWWRGEAEIRLAPADAPGAVSGAVVAAGLAVAGPVPGPSGLTVRAEALGSSARLVSLIRIGIAQNPRSSDRQRARGASSRRRSPVRREMRAAFSACSISMSRRLDGFIGWSGGQYGLDVAELVDQQGACALGADAGYAGHVIDAGIANQRLAPRSSCPGPTPKRSPCTSAGADRLLLDRVQHVDAGADELHQVLVGGHDGAPGPPASVVALRVGGDQGRRLSQSA